MRFSFCRRGADIFSPVGFPGPIDSALLLFVETPSLHFVETPSLHFVETLCLVFPAVFHRGIHIFSGDVFFIRVLSGLSKGFWRFTPLFY